GSFIGWQAWPCPTTGATCTVNPNQVVYVTAAFDGNQTVTLAIDQPENGTIRANVKGVYTNELICYSSGGGICEGEMPINSSIDVLALHIEGSAAWDGPCEGEWLVHLGYCPFTITKNTTVRSIFSDIGLWMVKATAPAHGAIRLSNGYERGTTCPGERCAIPLRLDEPLTATVIPDAGYVFDRWGDACAGQGATCRITPPGDKAERTVTAFFKLR
ncbi:MAG: hypothetical protein NTZ05_04490, partial [Chloroflexi bacterium]|nr:hypothetical protein [Chloroflexota bacterium]